MANRTRTIKPASCLLRSDQRQAVRNMSNSRHQTLSLSAPTRLTKGQLRESLPGGCIMRVMNTPAQSRSNLLFSPPLLVVSVQLAGSLVVVVVVVVQTGHLLPPDTWYLSECVCLVYSKSSMCSLARQQYKRGRARASAGLKFNLFSKAPRARA